MESVGEYFADANADSGVRRQEPGGNPMALPEPQSQPKHQDHLKTSRQRHGRTSERRKRYQGARRREPPAGSVPWGKTVLVDDGTCPQRLIKQITGGNMKYGIHRKRKCIPR